MRGALLITCMLLVRLQASQGLITCPTPNSCVSHSTCAIINGNEVCTCIDGFELDVNGITCNDIDECALGTKGCSQGCTNTIGGADCYCYEGYTQSSRFPLDCSDINECLTSNGGCQQTCTNSDGSFDCSCDVGYELWIDGELCDINECTVNNGGCQQICWNILGSFYCDCDIGFDLLADGTTCFPSSVSATPLPIVVAICRKYLVQVQDGVTMIDAHQYCETNNQELVAIPNQMTGDFIDAAIQGLDNSFSLETFWYKKYCPKNPDGDTNENAPKDGYICQIK